MKSTLTNNESSNETSPNTISTSQQSYDRLVDGFSKLIDLVKAETNYTPNENDLKIAALNTILNDLQNANSNVISKYTNYSNARIEKNDTLYRTANNLVDTAFDVKKYIKSVYGATSFQYKQISSITFSRPKL